MASAKDNSTERSRKWRAKKLAQGARPVSFTLLPGDGDALDVWHRLELDHGGPKAVVLHLLKLAAGETRLSNQELAALVLARMEGSRK